MTLRGLSLPVKPGPDGKAVMINDEDEQLAKIIAIGLSDCTSSNPFQDLGLPQSIIFDIGDDTTRGLVYDYLERFFTRLERQGRAKLTKLAPGSVSKTEGETVLAVEYTNLKTRSPKQMTFGFGRTGTVRVLEVA